MRGAGVEVRLKENGGQHRAALAKLDLEDNDMIVHTGSSDTGPLVPNGFGGYGEAVPGGTELGVLQKLAATGRAPSSGAPGNGDDGTRTGNGLTSSSPPASIAEQRCRTIIASAQWTAAAGSTAMTPPPSPRSSATERLAAGCRNSERCRDSSVPKERSGSRV
jgi:hypothetical protein